jgi:hypothetical protein
MKDLVTKALTDVSARSADALNAQAIKNAEAGTPWASVA